MSNVQIYKPRCDAVIVGARCARAKVLLVDRQAYGSDTVSTELSDAAFDTTLDEVVDATDVARRDVPVLEATDHLGTATDLMESTDEEHIPVVEDQETVASSASCTRRDACL